LIPLICFCLCKIQNTPDPEISIILHEGDHITPTKKENNENVAMFTQGTKRSRELTTSVLVRI